MSSQLTNANSFPTQLGRLEFKLENRMQSLVHTFSSWFKYFVRVLYSPSDLAISPVANPQPNSSLLQRIPLDIRLMIYGQMVVNMGVVLHIDEVDDSLKYLSCLGIAASTQRRPVLPVVKRAYHLWAIEHDLCQRRTGRIGASVGELGSYFALLLSCRIMSVFVALV